MLMANIQTGQAIFLDMVPGIREKRNCFKMRVLKKGVRDQTDRVNDKSTEKRGVRKII